jgi:SAM-dependent methyltransferase
MTIYGILRLLRNLPSATRAIYRSQNGNAPNQWFAGLNNDCWLWMNTVGRRRFNQIAAIVPGLPDAEFQAAFTGNSEDPTLCEGFAAYQLFKRCYEDHVGSLSTARVLDFGCGWGRIIRFFLRDVSPENLAGLDYNEAALEACRATNRWCRFTLIRPYPPTNLPAAEWDLIYLYSVFSHLPEEMHLALLREFHRLLRPGGLLIATTRQRNFILYGQDVRANHIPADPIRNEATALFDTNAALAAYDRGEFCYGRYKSDPPGFWGEACIPKMYVERRWSELFDVCEYIDNPSLCPQNTIVVRRRN